jgi:hypothetical protein
MPRPNSNIEANIAKYFVTAPLATANVVLGIIRATSAISVVGLGLLAVLKFSKRVRDL